MYVVTSPGSSCRTVCKSVPEMIRVATSCRVGELLRVRTYFGRTHVDTTDGSGPFALTVYLGDERGEFIEPIDPNALAMLLAAIEAGAPIVDPRAGRYFVTAKDGPRVWFLSGPYRTHSLAIDDVERVRRLAGRENPWSAFYWFGTARLRDGEPDRVGNLQRLGLDLLPG